MAAEGMARTLYRSLAGLGDRYSRGRMAIPVAEEHSERPTIYFLTPDHPAPSGGIRVIYRHVDILNAAGMDAYVLHRRQGFRCDWFEHETRITNCRQARIRQGDLLVVSEVDVDLLERVPQSTRYVIFNQNSHLTWKRAGLSASRHYAAGSGLAGVVSVSRHNQEMLQLAFGSGQVRRVHLGIDGELFHPGAHARARQIGYMPRRGGEDARQVIEMLRQRGILDDWTIIALDGLHHTEVAERLRTTRIFLAFTHQEGFGLPAAEAMACGNYVIGNHGFGGREFFLPQFSTAVDNGDIIGFVRAVEDAIANDRVDGNWCRDRGMEASRFIRAEYRVERERAEVVALYSELLGASSSETSAAARRTGTK